MDKVAALPDRDRSDLFRETASQRAVHPAIIEKDFWVCWVLRKLFTCEGLKGHLIFKGGTSLSKVYGLIERFSEDIDLILDWRLLGYSEDGRDPWEKQPSHTKQDTFNKAINAAAVEYIAKTLQPQLRALFAQVPAVTLDVPTDEPLVVNIAYPKAFTLDAIRPQVKLEIGPLASWVPSKEAVIKPYAAEVFEHVFDDPACRTNRLDGDDKDFGYIVDYMDLFKKVEKSIAVYSSELAPSTDGVDPAIMVQDRLAKGQERLDNSLEKLEHLCEPIEAPGGALEVIKYFCGNTEIPEDLVEREPRRALLYKATASFVRSYANLADDLPAAGYEPGQVDRIKERLKHFLDLRQIVRNASGEHLDLKAYEADMRHLIDTYIEADAAKKISPFDNVGLLDLIVKSGIAEAIAQKLGSMANNQKAIAETIENNVRSKITKEQLTDPAFYERMSKLLDEVIKARKKEGLAYLEYLKKIAQLAKQVQQGRDDSTPKALDSPGRRAIYNQLRKVLGADAANGKGQDDDILAVAMKIDDHIKANRPNAWRGHQPKEQRIKELIHEVVQDIDVVESLFAIIKAQREY